MKQFSIEKALELGAACVQTRCGFNVIAVGEINIDEFSVFAIVLEVVTDTDGHRRKRRLRKKLEKKHVEQAFVLYHADGRIYADHDDDFDLVIVDSDNNEDK